MSTQVEPVGSRHCAVVYNGNNTGGNRGQRFPSHQPHHHPHNESAADRSWLVSSLIFCTSTVHFSFPHAVCPVDRAGLCHPRHLCCLTDCSAEAVVCVERVQMAIMRNSVRTTTSTHTSLNTHRVGSRDACRLGTIISLLMEELLGESLLIIPSTEMPRQTHLLGCLRW